MALSELQIAQYRRDGYVSPVPVIDRKSVV